ncbi:hypothetical protein PDESU_03128 [Pontiella desulfatans]|uniref:Outer membrane protein beta-barrel domain-containing protein n=1 Tax=Pontiella desulfatans TaxID=2750659 RepID=A0A6C2U3V3_PONDE|nr:outer membrane beta-barrel protein [Pontiella desulfatans]VGO14565.1 hypothetical protein PDESU_03128 [Pontiella desulfatans]
MGKKAYCILFAALLVSAFVGTSANAQMQKGSEARFAIGATFASGMLDVNDYITDMYEANGYEIDSFVLPVGLTFVGGYRFGFGMEILGDFGPVSLIMVDDGSDDVYLNVDVPVGLTVGYAFFTAKPVSPYVRGGFRYHFTGGDFTEDSEPGIYLAGGVNFFSNKGVQLQLEVAYDGSTVTYRPPEDSGIYYPWEEIEPGGLLVSIRAAF